MYSFTALSAGSTSGQRPAFPCQGFGEGPPCTGRDLREQLTQASCFKGRIPDPGREVGCPSSHRLSKFIQANLLIGDINIWVEAKSMFVKALILQLLKALPIPSLILESFPKCSSESRFTGRASSGPASTGHVHKTCFRKRYLAALELTSFWQMSP